MAQRLLHEMRTGIESALEDTMDKAAAACREVTVMCCGAKADLAHTINHEAEQKTELVISQLSHLHELELLRAVHIRQHVPVRTAMGGP